MLTLVYLVSIVGVAVYTCNHKHKSTIVAMSDGECACSCHHAGNDCCASKHSDTCDAPKSVSDSHMEADCCTIAIVSLEIDQQPEHQKRIVDNVSELALLFITTFVQYAYDFSDGGQLYANAISPHSDISPTTPLIYQLSCLRL